MLQSSFWEMGFIWEIKSCSYAGIHSSEPLKHDSEKTWVLYMISLFTHEASCIIHEDCVSFTSKDQQIWPLDSCNFTGPASALPPGQGRLLWSQGLHEEHGSSHRSLKALITIIIGLRTNPRS